jgi:hypothetical protein
MALYERQRALVRAGLLDAVEGHGPGSGVRTTAESVAILLISVLSTDSLTEAETRSADIANATPLGGGRCPLTGMQSFRDAIASLLTSAARSARVIEISVSRTASRAVIHYREGRATRTSEFVGDLPDEPELRVVATLSATALRRIAGDVQAMVHEKFDEATT